MSVFFSMNLDTTVQYWPTAGSTWVTLDPLASAPDHTNGCIRVHHIDVSLAASGSVVDFQYGRVEVYDSTTSGGSHYFGGVMTGGNNKTPTLTLPTNPRGLDEVLGSHYLEGVGHALSIDFPDPIESIRNHDIGGADEGFGLFVNLASNTYDPVGVRVNVWAEAYR